MNLFRVRDVVINLDTVGAITLGTTPVAASATTEPAEKPCVVVYYASGKLSTTLECASVEEARALLSTFVP